MAARFMIYGDCRSGNCMKVLWTADYVGADYEWIEIDILNGGARTDEFLALNPAGQAPALVTDEGAALAESNAIMLFLAEGSDLIPKGAFSRAKMMQWLFWEQYSHEPYIAKARTQRVFGGAQSVDGQLLAAGRRALGVMEMRLIAQDYLAGQSLTLADIALLPYTRLAPEGGFDLSGFPALLSWIHRIESALGLERTDTAVQPA